ncbi:GNAT family N-acetyltransferase [Stappia sp.]|uniref:GNAT family N-acetyltransferase n=1 Tax=Stappia sp. TaxID=1870903 RepID=UPI003A9A3B1B
MRLTVRRAGPFDARALAEVLETAGDAVAAKKAMRAQLDAHGTLCHLVEDEHGIILGFQCIAPIPEVGAGAGIISFTISGNLAIEAGSTLFKATRAAARDAGFDWLEARVRADNTKALTYYQSRGFEALRDAAPYLRLRYDLR